MKLLRGRRHSHFTKDWTFTSGYVGHGTPSGSAASLPEGLRSCSVALGSWTLHSSLGQHCGIRATQLRAFLEVFIAGNCTSPVPFLPVKFHELSDCHSISSGWLFRKGMNQDRIRLCMIKSCWVTFNIDFRRFPKPLRRYVPVWLLWEPWSQYLSAWCWHVMHEARSCNSTSWNVSRRRDLRVSSLLKHAACQTFHHANCAAVHLHAMKLRLWPSMVRS